MTTFLSAFRKLVGIQIMLCVAIMAGTAQADLFDGLLNYYTLDGHFDDTAGSLPGNTSTVDDNGTQPAESVTFAAGALGDYGVFNGDPEAFVEVPDSDDIVATGEGLAISAWFNVTSLDDGWQALVAHGESADYRVARRSSDSVMSSRVGAGDIPTSAIGPDITDGEWHHVVANAPLGGDTEIWVDGELIETGGPTAITDNGSGRLMIGGNPDTGPEWRTWNGGIDDVAMWDRGLTVEEIGEIYNAGVAGVALAEIGAAPSCAGQAIGDIDCDGEVAFADFLILSANFGATTAAGSTVPEPTGFAMLGLAGLLGGIVRRRRS